MLKASHCIAIALAFLVAASLRASAGERPDVSRQARVDRRASAAHTPSDTSRYLPWRLVFR